MHVVDLDTIRSHTAPSPRPGLILRWALGLLLLFAAAMKGYQLSAQPPAGTSLLESRLILIAQVGFEAVLGLWLLAGIYPRAAWITSLVCFTVFSAVSVHKAIRGDASCGCFGPLSINPWYTAALDAAAVMLILLLRRQVLAASRPRMGRARSLTLMAAIGLFGVSSTIWIMRSQPAVLNETRDLSPGEAVIFLKPDTWVGKPFPLIEHATIGPQIACGRWIVVVYNSYCGHCRPAVPEYEQLSIDLAGRQDAPRIALIEVPPCAPPGQNRASGLTPALLGHLSPERKWFIITPLVLAISDGKVLAIAGDEPAATWVTRVFTER